MFGFLKNLFYEKQEEVLQTDLSKTSETIAKIGQDGFVTKFVEENLPENYNSPMIDSIWERLKTHKEMEFEFYHKETRLDKYYNFVYTKIPISNGKIRLNMSLHFNLDGEPVGTRLAYDISEKRNPNLSSALQMVETICTTNDHLYLLSLYLRDRDELVRMYKEKEMERFNEYLKLSEKEPIEGE
jgi:hypothetical protein